MSRIYFSDLREIYSVINRLPDNKISQSKPKRNKKERKLEFFLFLLQLDESVR